MSSELSFDRLYRINDPLGTRAFRGKFGAPPQDAFAFSRAERVPATPVRVTWAMGTAEPGDVVWATTVAALVVHERVLEVLSRAHVTGWSTYPIEALNKSGEPVGGFCGLAVHGRCAARDLTRSEIVLREYRAGWLPFFRGCYFDEASWDGSDLFLEHPLAPGRAGTARMATEIVVKELKKARISNLRFTPLAEYVEDTLKYQVSLQECLPPDFAAQVRRAYSERGVPMPEFIEERLSQLGVR